MALTGKGMADAVFDAMKPRFGDMTDKQLEDVYNGILIAETARVLYIQANADVTTSVTTAVIGTLTPPVAVAGTGTGVGTGKVL